MKGTNLVGLDALERDAHALSVVGEVADSALETRALLLWKATDARERMERASGHASLGRATSKGRCGLGRSERGRRGRCSHGWRGDGSWGSIFGVLVVRMTSLLDLT